MESTSVKSEMVGPLSASLRNALIGKPSRSTCITCLLSAGSPFTIALAVWTIVVYAFNARAGEWPLPHVRQEVQWRFSPASTHCDTASTVILVRGRVAVIASVLHGGPDAILWCPNKTMSPMPPSLACFGPEATAGSCKSVVDGISKAFHHRSAIAATLNPSDLPSGSEISENNQSTESIPHWNRTSVYGHKNDSITALLRCCAMRLES